MLVPFLIMQREGMEAALIVGIVAEGVRAIFNGLLDSIFPCSGACSQRCGCARLDAQSWLPFFLGGAIKDKRFSKYKLNPCRICVCGTFVVINNGSNTTTENDVPPHATISARDSSSFSFWVFRIFARNV